MTSNTAQRTQRLNCLTVARHLQKNLGILSKAALERKIRLHLRTCPNCSAYLDSLKKTVKMYQKAPCPRLENKVRESLFHALKLRGSIH